MPPYTDTDTRTDTQLEAPPIVKKPAPVITEPPIEIMLTTKIADSKTGGARPGAGRPKQSPEDPLIGVRVYMPTSLHEELVEIAGQRGLSALIRDTLESNMTRIMGKAARQQQKKAAAEQRRKDAAEAKRMRFVRKNKAQD